METETTNIQSENDKRFSIAAFTYTLKQNSTSGNHSTLLDGTKYIIPIYQRPYSWTEEQIRKFIADIFLGYWGTDGHILKEPMFIGTMQLAKKNLRKKEQEVIDGQQRLTTVLMLLKVLKMEFPSCSSLKAIDLDWLETKVNNGTEQSDLNQVLLANTLLENDVELNKYAANSVLIKNIFFDVIASAVQKEENETETQFAYEDFIDYLLSSIYFVVIETCASLSKTLQIFNAINTTGLDLNGGDIFKLRMYEYLCDQNKDASDEEKSEIFNQISKLYEAIYFNNKKFGEEVTDIVGVLEIYKYILIAKYDLVKSLYFYETNRFYEELFDTIANTNRFENFKNAKQKGVKLSLDELHQVLDGRYKWYLIYKNPPTAEDSCSWHFIWMSRYSRYHILGYIYCYKFSSNADFVTELFLFLKQLSKLFIIYSIRFQKLKSEIYYTFMYDVLTTVILGSPNETIQLINSKIGKIENHKHWYDIEDILSGDITYNAKLKNIVCRLSGLLNEDYISSNRQICRMLFHSEPPIDIEHIQSYHDKNGEKRQEIWDEWQDDINSIGNLMVLEQYLNRSIGNDHYEDKIKLYPSSVFSVVKNQVRDFQNWNLQKCQERKSNEVRKILNYLFN